MGFGVQWLWEGSTAGEAGGEVEGDEAFSGAGIADEERDFAAGDATGPEPVDAAGADVGQAEGAEAGARRQIGERSFGAAGMARFFAVGIERPGVRREEVGGVDVIVDLEGGGLRVSDWGLRIDWRRGRRGRRGSCGGGLDNSNVCGRRLRRR